MIFLSILRLFQVSYQNAAASHYRQNGYLAIPPTLLTWKHSFLHTAKVYIKQS